MNVPPLVYYMGTWPFAYAVVAYLHGRYVSRKYDVNDVLGFIACAALWPLCIGIGVLVLGINGLSWFHRKGVADRKDVD